VSTSHLNCCTTADQCCGLVSVLELAADAGKLAFGLPIVVQYGAKMLHFVCMIDRQLRRDSTYKPVGSEGIDVLFCDTLTYCVAQSPKLAWPNCGQAVVWNVGRTVCRTSPESLQRGYQTSWDFIIV
jgi:hypothetical protein